MEGRYFGSISNRSGICIKCTFNRKLTNSSYAVHIDLIYFHCI